MNGLICIHRIYGLGYPQTMSSYQARGHSEGGSWRLNGATDLKVKAHQEYQELVYLDDCV